MRTKGVEAPSWLRREWLRGKYYIEGGFIKPVAGAKAEPYEPMQKRPKKRGDTEHRSLVVDLARLDSEDEADIQRFCNRWGLLGLRQHYVVADWQEQFGSPSPGVFGYDLYPGLRCETFFSAGLRSSSVRYLSSSELWACNPGTYLPEVGDPSWEPLAWFRLAARQFQTAVRIYGLWESGEAVPPDTWLVFASIVHRNLSGVRETVDWTEVLEAKSRIANRALKPHVLPPVCETVLWPSLLAAAYLMLRQEVTGGRGLRICADEHCRKPFMPSRAAKLYCCERCSSRKRQREWQRRHPNRKKAA